MRRRFCSRLIFLFLIFPYTKIRIFLLRKTLFNACYFSDFGVKKIKVTFFLLLLALNLLHICIMKKFIYYLLTARVFSEMAKRDDYEVNHPYTPPSIKRKVEELERSTMCEVENAKHDGYYLDYWARFRNYAYYEKEFYIKKALKYLPKNIKCVFDLNECCIYFELPKGQVSMHFFCDSDGTIELFKKKGVEIVESYQWSGLHNTSKILLDTYHDLK